MDFAGHERSEELRAVAQSFLAEHYTEDVRNRVAESGAYFDPEFHRAMAAAGLVAAHWPVAEGGQGWDRSDTDVVYEEMASAGAPLEGFAVTMIVAETIRRHGTARQKAMLAAVPRGELNFALGYTEPGSGSDLASVSTRATRTDTGWLIDGQKIFTTQGHDADYVFLLARTDPDVPKHQGLSLFLVPTTDPGFSVAPIFTLSGQRTNVTYYSGIQVGDDALIGEPGQGWQIINVALAFERGGEFAAQLKRLVAAAVEWGRTAGRADDTRFLTRLGRAVAATEVSRLLGAQASWLRASARAGAVEGSMAKVFATEALVEHTGSLLDTAGIDGLRNPRTPGAPAGGELQHLYRESQIATLYGGTSEVLRGIVAQQRLRLPRTKSR